MHTIPPMRFTTPSVLLISVSFLGNTALAATLPGDDATVTRAQLTQAMVLSIFSTESIDGCLGDLSRSRYRLLFTDVKVDDSFAPALCMGMKGGLIRGYKDGSFRPNRPINFAEAAKIISRAMALKPVAGLPEGSPWYMNYVKALESRHAIPVSIKSFDQPMTATDLDEIMRRLRNDITSLPSRTYDELRKRMEAGR